MQQGTVKWFNSVKGYGFIVGDNGETVFVHQSDILMNGFRFLETGQKVNFKLRLLKKVIKQLM